MRKECICLSQKEYERVMIIKMVVEGFYSNRETDKLLNLSVR
jgi:DNA-binding CsgD family transcriptional regulator